jgi:hypothetical protein
LIDDDLDLQEDREEEVEEEIDAHINEFSGYEMPNRMNLKNKWTSAMYATVK